MMNRDYIALLEQIIGIAERYSSLYRFLKTCNDINERMGDKVRVNLVVGSQPRKARADHEIQAFLQDIRSVLSRVGYSALFLQIYACTDELRQLFKRLGNLQHPAEIIMRFDDKLNTLRDFLHSFLDDFTPSSGLSLVEWAAALSDDYRLVHDYSWAALEVLEPENAPPPGMDQLTIFLPKEQTYREVVDKLTAIADLYDEVCTLAGVSPAEFPLRVAKVESGSLWLKIFGESKVMALIAKLIENGANFTYRNFTQEGKLREIPRNIEIIRAELKLLEELEAAGIPTTKIRETIEKSSVIIADKINTLLFDANEITVNKNTYGMRQELERLIDRQSKARLIEDGSQHQAAGDEEPDRPMPTPAPEG
jgi:hypothetical protein